MKKIMKKFFGVFDLFAHRDDLVRSFLRQLLAGLRIRLGACQLFAQLGDGGDRTLELRGPRRELRAGRQ